MNEGNGAYDLGQRLLRQFPWAERRSASHLGRPSCHSIGEIRRRISGKVEKLAISISHRREKGRGVVNYRCTTEYMDVRRGNGGLG